MFAAARLATLAGRRATFAGRVASVCVRDARRPCVSERKTMLVTGAVRRFAVSSAVEHVSKCPKGEGYKLHYITPAGDRITVWGREGENLLEIAHANGIDLEGACECSLACSTCHVIVDDAYYDKLDEPSDEENDMLDLAFGLTETSRLGCQLHMSKDLDGITVKLPSATRNVQSTKLKL